MPEEDLADLTTSQKGWAKVDYNRTLWIPCPPASIMPEGYDTERWAREFSEIWWGLSGFPHGVNELSRLAAQLAYLQENTWGYVACHQAYIQLPDPRWVPLPVYLAILKASGERSARLRVLAAADDPDAVRPPFVEEFTTDQLGPGLRVLRHSRESAGAADVAGQEPEIYAGLSYAWRSEEFDTDLRLWTAAPDLGRVQEAIPDIDELARHITVVARH